MNKIGDKKLELITTYNPGKPYIPNKDMSHSLTSRFVDILKQEEAREDRIEVYQLKKLLPYAAS
jgi:hypothetical protein